MFVKLTKEAGVAVRLSPLKSRFVVDWNSQQSLISQYRERDRRKRNVRQIVGQPKGDRDIQTQIVTEGERQAQS